MPPHEHQIDMMPGEMSTRTPYFWSARDERMRKSSLPPTYSVVTSMSKGA